MTYKDYYEYIRGDCIRIDDIAQQWYVDPDYYYFITHEAEFKMSDVEDFPELTIGIIKQKLDMEVATHNGLIDREYVVTNFLADLFGNIIQPQITDNTNKLFADFIEYVGKKTSAEPTA